MQQYDAPTIEKGKGTYKNYFKADFRAKNPDSDYTVYFNFSGFDVPNADTPMTRPLCQLNRYDNNFDDHDCLFMLVSAGK